MDILNIVREEASKVYKTDGEINAFMEGFEKQAGLDLLGGLGTRLLNNEKFMEAVYRSGLGLAAGLAAIGITKAVTSSSSAITNNALKSKFESSLQQIKNTNKIVKNANQFKVESYAKTLFSFAPHVASDPNMLSTLLSHVIQGEGVDPMIVKTITDLEARYKENVAPGSLTGFRV